ncbi:MAG: alpha/beta hydrolase [Firmicutes bacterium]|nr:alpha/beta hydrolase [Bacillota bacterium]
MPSLISAMLRQQIRLFKPILTNFSTTASRNLQEALGELGAKALGDKVEFREFHIGAVPAALAVPVKPQPGDQRVVLYLHGGGYVAGSIKYAKGFAGVLAAKAGLRVLCIAYRLAPENPFPAALEDALSAYEYLLAEGCAPENIFLIGESAGGGLLFSLCLLLKSLGRPLPGRLVALSPWTDLSLSGESYRTKRKEDPCLSMKEIEGFVHAYAPPELRDPLASPLFGALSGLPPCRIYVGEDELLLDDSRLMAEKLLSAGVECRLHVEPGLWHAYVLFGVPEANAALEEIKVFFEEGFHGKTS